MRDFDELKLARVIDACGGIDGRVKLQKIVYLLQVMGYDVPFEDFMIRQHGPFSRSVAWATDMLKGADVLEETKTALDESEDGKDVELYSYQVRKDLSSLIRKSFDVHGPVDGPPLDEIAKRLRQFDRAVLEIAATRVFLEREGLSGGMLDQELKRLKGHLLRFPEAEQLLLELRQYLPLPQ